MLSLGIRSRSWFWLLPTMVGCIFSCSAEETTSNDEPPGLNKSKGGGAGVENTGGVAGNSTPFPSGGTENGGTSGGGVPGGAAGEGGMLPSAGIGGIFSGGSAGQQGGTTQGGAGQQGGTTQGGAGQQGGTTQGGAGQQGGTTQGGAGQQGGTTQGGSNGCVPNCAGQQCGLDPVCGTSCGQCNAGEQCTAQGMCQPTCVLPGGLCSKTPLYTSQIGLWYTIWWMEGGDSGHWKEWSRYKPTAGYYRSGQGVAFSAHLAAFQAMKLDFLLLDHTNGVGADGGQLAANADALTKTLEDTKSPVKQAVATGAGLWVGPSPDLAAQQAEDDFIFSHHSSVAHSSRFLWKGLPLLVIYTAPGAGDDWIDSRFTIGLATGTVSAASALMKSRGLFGWVFDEPTPIDKRVMGVMPGWNTAHLGRQTTPIQREGGNLFVRQWLRAIKENPEIIVINSWNDFAEETAIEPATRTEGNADLWADSYGTECPAFYADLARGYSLLRFGLEAGAYVREENNVMVYLVTANGLVAQGVMPKCHPVLFVPDGYLAQFPKI